METAQINVYQNNNFIHFLIKFPNPERVCKKVIIYPVSHRDKILDFGINNIVAECDNEVLAVGNCERTTTTTFCMELQNTTCAQQLHSGELAHCNTQHNDLDPIMEIDEGIIIINDIVTSVESRDSNTQIINGTFLITFDDEAWINGTHFSNHNNTHGKQPAAATSPLLNITGHHDLLSISFLHKLNTNNLRYIGQLEKKLNNQPLMICCATLGIAITCYTMKKLSRRCKDNRKEKHLQNVIAAIRKPEDGLHLKEGGVNAHNHE